MKIAYWLPLLGYVLPTLAIGFGVVIPRSCIAGVNALTLGFLASVGTSAIAYAAGQILLLRDIRSRHAHNRAPGSAAGPLPLRLRHAFPALAYVLVNAGLGFGVVIPGSCIAGFNPVTTGFFMAVLAGTLTCGGGLLLVRGELRQAGERAFYREHPTFMPLAVPPVSLLPGAAYVAVTLAAGFGFVIPGSCIAGANELTIGFAVGTAAAGLTCWAGIAGAIRAANSRRMQSWPHAPAQRPPALRLRDWLPLGAYLAFTLGTAFGLAIPGTCMAGINGLSVGFLAATLLAVPTYGLGLALALRPAMGSPARHSPLAWLWRRIAEQARQPSGPIGRALFAIMARETRRDNLTAVLALEPAPHHSVLEVGFGHGQTLQALLDSAPRGRVFGVDWSVGAVALASRKFT